MAKKSTSKTSAKKPAAKTTKKKSTINKKKLKAKPKASPFKSKLGHDPLAWITGEEASDLGVSFDDIDAKVESTKEEMDQILPSVDNSIYAESEQTSIETTALSESQKEASEAENIPESIESTDGSWGLFDDDQESDKSNHIEAESKSNSPDNDDSWGLFDDDPETSSLPIGEGVAWGLFADESATSPEVDHDAIIIHLPAAFNVSEISKIYHDFDEHMNKDHDVVVDASEVETIDATGLQLLFACQKELQQRGCKMIIKDASEKAELLSSSSFINELIGMAG